MDADDPRALTDEQIVEAMRRAASIWFKNTDLLVLEELIKRFERSRLLAGDAA